MADSISKLYAEIGFKVNTEGLDQAKKLLSEFAEQISAINELTKKQASLYGVFTKEKAKQETEKEKQATEQKKAETQRIKQSLKETTHKQQLERMAVQSELQEKRFKQKEQEHLWRVEEQGLRKHNETTFKSVASNVKKITKEIWKGGKLIATSMKDFYGSIVAPSLNRSIATRDFMLYSGTPLENIQKIQERLVNVGSNMTQEEMMGELTNALDNITKIGFGKGTLSGYKLSNIVAPAYRRDISGLLNAISRETADIDNQKLVELLEEMNLSGQKWLPYFRAQQRTNAEMPRLTENEQKDLVNTRIAINQLVYSFQKVSEVFSARLSPALSRAADLIKNTFIQTMENLDEKGFGQQIEEIAQELSEFIKLISPKAIATGIKTFFEAIKDFAKIVNWIAEKLHLKEKPKEEETSGGEIKPTTFLGVPLFVKKAPKESISTGQKFSNVDLTKQWADKSPKPTTVNIYNNQSVNTNIETTNDELGYTVAEGVREGINMGGKEQFAFARDVYVMGSSGAV